MKKDFFVKLEIEGSQSGNEPLGVVVTGEGTESEIATIVALAMANNKKISKIFLLAVKAYIEESKDDEDEDEEESSGSTAQTRGDTPCECKH